MVERSLAVERASLGLDLWALDMALKFPDVVILRISRNSATIKRLRKQKAVEGALLGS